MVTCRKKEKKRKKTEKPIFPFLGKKKKKKKKNKKKKKKKNEEWGKRYGSAESVTQKRRNPFVPQFPYHFRLSSNSYGKKREERVFSFAFLL